MKFQSIVANPLTPHIGAEIVGVDLARPLSEQCIAELKTALWKYSVIFFRDQTITPEQQMSFGRLFGELHTHPAARNEAEMTKVRSDGQPETNANYVYHVDGHPEVLVIQADENSKRVAGENWHTDVSCDLKPPMGSILYLTEVPPAGGDTLFSSMYAAYDALSDRMKEFLLPLTAIHDGNKIYQERFAAPGKSFPKNEHPIIRTHPETGRKALFVNCEFTTRIVQLQKAESESVLQFLFRHVETAEFQCRFRWSKNSIAFWDNRCTQHHAMWDYFPQRRYGHRVTIIGERPV